MKAWMQSIWPAIPPSLPPHTMSLFHHSAWSCKPSSSIYSRKVCLNYREVVAKTTTARTWVAATKLVEILQGPGRTLSRVNPIVKITGCHAVQRVIRHGLFLLGVLNLAWRYTIHYRWSKGGKCVWVLLVVVCVESQKIGHPTQSWKFRELPGGNKIWKCYFLKNFIPWKINGTYQQRGMVKNGKMKVWKQMIYL